MGHSGVHHEGTVVVSQQNTTKREPCAQHLGCIVCNECYAGLDHDDWGTDDSFKINFN